MLMQNFVRLVVRIYQLLTPDQIEFCTFVGSDELLKVSDYGINEDRKT